MPRVERAFYAINWPERTVVLAKTKKQAAERALEVFDDPDTSANALTARVSFIRYCTRYRVLWFQLRGQVPRLLAPEYVPDTFWPWIAEEAAPEGFDTPGTGHWHCDLPSGQGFQECQVEPSADLGARLT